MERPASVGLVDDLEVVDHAACVCSDGAGSCAPGASVERWTQVRRVKWSPGRAVRHVPRRSGEVGEHAQVIAAGERHVLVDAAPVRRGGRRRKDRRQLDVNADRRRADRGGLAEHHALGSERVRQVQHRVHTDRRRLGGLGRSRAEHADNDDRQQRHANAASPPGGHAPDNHDFPSRRRSPGEWIWRRLATLRSVVVCVVVTVVSRHNSRLTTALHAITAYGQRMMPGSMRKPNSAAKASEIACSDANPRSSASGWLASWLIDSS